MQIQLCVLFLLALSVRKCFSIECYVCSSLNNEACVKPDSSKIPMKKCNLKELQNTKDEAAKIESSFRELFEVDPTYEPQLSSNCLKQVTKVGDTTYVLRGCQLATVDNKLDVCVKVKKLRKDRVQTQFCELCNGNGCNSAEWRLKINRFALVFGSIFAMIFSKA